MRTCNRLPCTECKEDTLHVNLRCITCGNIFLTPTVQRKIGAMNRGFMHRTKQLGPRDITGHNAAARAARAKDVRPYYDLPRPSSGAYGAKFGRSGRERIKI